MELLHSNEQHFVPNTQQTPWLKLWIINWNYTHWLMTSIITTVLSSEVYSLLLSIYPHFLTTFWFNLGVTSTLLASMLSVSTVLLTGLLSGWLVYSAHLAYYAFKTANLDYQPLIELWQGFNEGHGELIDNLFTDKQFLSLSKFLHGQHLPEPIQSFLSNSDNIQQISKAMSLLKRIWHIEKVDDKIKALSLNILSEFAKTSESQEHFNNIWNLCDLLLKNNQFTPEMVLKSLENNQQLKDYLPTLSQIASHHDLLHKLIDEPRLMAFFLAAQDEFHGQDERISHNIDLLYIYLRQQFEVNDSYQAFKNSNHPWAKHATVTSEMFQWNLNFASNAQQFIKIWDNLVHHPAFNSTEDTIIFMLNYPDRYQSITHHYESALSLTGLFNSVAASQSEEFVTVSQFFGALTNQDEKELYCDTLIHLLQCKLLKESLLIELIHSDDWKKSAMNIGLYAEKVWTPEILDQVAEDDLRHFMIHNQDSMQPQQPVSCGTAGGLIITPKPQASENGFFSLFTGCIACSSSPLSKDEEIRMDIQFNTPKPK